MPDPVPLDGAIPAPLDADVIVIQLGSDDVAAQLQFAVVDTTTVRAGEPVAYTALTGGLSDYSHGGAAVTVTVTGARSAILAEAGATTPRTPR